MGSTRILLRRGPLAAALASIALAACGGGGGDGATTTTTTQSTPVTTPPATTTPPAPAAPLTITGLDAACAGCGATNGSTYAGSGVGIWSRANTSGAAADVQYAINGIAGQSIGVVLTNTTGQSQLVPGLALSSLDPSVTGLSAKSLSAVVAGTDDAAERAHREIAEFNRNGWVKVLGESSALRSIMSVPPVQQAVINDTRGWYHSDQTLRQATLLKQATVAGGAVTVNLWVEQGESGTGKVTDALQDELIQSFADPGKIYDMLVSVGGPLWGTHSFPSDFIGGTGQPIDIVVLNFNKDAKAFGTVGYFWGLNAMTKTASGARATSNESVSLYLDAETLYLGGTAGRKAIKMTMAHEGMHMQNFYRRGVSFGKDYVFDTWLDEMTAMMMEDFASYTIDSTYNAIRDVRFADYVRTGSYNCNLVAFVGQEPDGCDSYSVSGSLGGFLNRQLGLTFFKNLLATKGSMDSKTALDQAIRSVAPASSLNEQLLRWTTTSNTLMPAASTPTGYGYPGRNEGGFTLPQIDPALYGSLRKLPTTAPLLLMPYGSFPLKRAAVNGTYTDKVRVPAGSTLSVVVY